VEQVNPDVVIVATGANYTTPDLPGITDSKVITNAQLHGQLETALNFTDPTTLRWLTNFYLPTEKDVVIIGGQIQGVQVAELLVQRGKNVTIVEDGPEANIGKGMPDTSRQRLVYYLQTHGVKIITDVKYNEINSEGLSITLQNNLVKTLPAGSIVLALPLAANTDLADQLKSKVKEVYAIGDCSEPGVIETSVASANLTARKV
jgi:pyruvate/2-oxoglutarate dehydrogenase complex dihydrolipoamide dehydrogenase (E3) component